MIPKTEKKTVEYYSVGGVVLRAYKDDAPRIILRTICVRLQWRLALPIHCILLLHYRLPPPS